MQPYDWNIRDPVNLWAPLAFLPGACLLTWMQKHYIHANRCHKNAFNFKLLFRKLMPPQLSCVEASSGSEAPSQVPATWAYYDVAPSLRSLEPARVSPRSPPFINMSTQMVAVGFQPVTKYSCLLPCAPLDDSELHLLLRMKFQNGNLSGQKLWSINRPETTGNFSLPSDVGYCYTLPWHFLAQCQILT